MGENSEEQEILQRKAWGGRLALGGIVVAVAGAALWLSGGEPLIGSVLLGLGLAAGHRGWQEARAARLRLDLIMLERIGGRLKEQIALEKERRKEDGRRQIAGVSFEDHAGVFDGEPVYKYATKEGRRYEYAGIAGKSDEPSETTLIINDLVYKLAAAKK